MSSKKQATKQKKPAPRDPLDAFRDRERAKSTERVNKQLLRRLHAAEEASGVVEALRAANRPIAPIVVSDRIRGIAGGAKGLRIATPVFLCSDWHVEETVKPETVNHTNAYTLDIADKRIERLGDAMLWMIDHHRKSFEVREAVLALDGDLMTGYIHPELIETAALSPVQTIVWLKQRVRRLIAKLLSVPRLERLTIICNPGNHGRTTEKTRISTYTANSFEWLLYTQLRECYENDPRVAFHVAEGEFAYINVHGFELRTTHGDAAKYGGGVGGIMIPINKAIAKWDTHKRADVTFMGHFHQLHYLPRVVINGSLIGTSAYGMRVGAFEPPAQASVLIDAKRGMCMNTTLWPTTSQTKHEYGKAA